VVATAGPALESILAARGAGAASYSAETGKTVFHMDIGGGTANLALIENGQITCTDCLNVGGRLIKIENQHITYISPVLRGLCDFTQGQFVTPEDLAPIADLLVQALEMSAGLRPPTELLSRLRTAELGTHRGCDPQNAVISFSGGVADCIDTEHPPFSFGDIGPILGQAIRKSRLCQNAYRLGEETIRATVIGAGCHSAQLSGSTVYYQNMSLPVKNRPVVTLTKQEQSLPEQEFIACIRQKLAGQDTLPVLSLPGLESPDYGSIKALAAALAQALPSPALVTVEQDMAKALGQAIALHRPANDALLCIDRVRLKDGDYLDVGNPIGPSLPVVVKTLILEK
jgi:ethanolamine utilization protein EutA